MKSIAQRCALLCISLWVIATALPTLAAPALDYQIIAERSHKPSLFTQGLQIENGQFYESSGLYGKSLLVSYPVAEPAGSTWAKISVPFSHQFKLPERFFAEGLTLVGDKIYLLTWQEQTLLIFNKAKFTYHKSLPYQGEGWGLAYDGKNLIRSDGSDRLFIHEPEQFRLLSSLQVTDQGKPVVRLNELEYAQGFMWANIWQEDKIIKIDPNSGQVLGELNLAALRQSLGRHGSDDVLNGIAWDETQQAFWITGKLWPKMFLLRVADGKSHN